jgi:hypothetical protein
MDLTLVGMGRFRGNINLRTPIEGVGVAGRRSSLSQDWCISGLHG